METVGPDVGGPGATGAGGRTLTETPQLRIALTIAGAASLGAYEGGALTALIYALAPLYSTSNARVRIDVIGGASAGSMTGLLAARCITKGLDPLKVLQMAWIETDSIKNLLRGYEGAPFSTRVLRQQAAEVMGLAVTEPVQPREHPIELVMTAVVLRGLEYKVSGVAAAPMDATTYLDLFRATIDGSMSVDDFVSGSQGPLIDMALASGANEFGFRPEGVDRHGLQPRYATRGLSGFPQTEFLWYSDGGTLDNEPLGRTLTVTTAIDEADRAPFRRLHLLVHPHTAAVPPPQSKAWADPDNRPTWSETLLRASQILLLQGVYDDLRRVSKTNTRVSWLEQLDTALGPVVAGLGSAERVELADALTGVLRAIDTKRATLPAHHGPTSTSTSSDPADLLHQVVAHIAGIAGKDRVEVDAIVPKLTPHTTPLEGERLLRGTAMADFGGFLDEDVRRHDFDVGYQSTVAWIEGGGLTGHGLSETESDDALRRLRTRHRVELFGAGPGADGTHLLRRHPLWALRLLGRFGRVGIGSSLTAGRRRQQ